MALLEAIGGIVGGLIDKSAGEEQADKQAELQKEFAQTGIRWKVKDAIRAGIHPLYALGASTAQYSPITVGTDFATQGQNLGRAITAMATDREKAGGFEKTVQNLTLEKMGLENEVLRSQLATIRQPSSGPGMPSSRMMPGQGSTPAVEMTTAGGGFKIKVDAGNTPANTAENQYGEIGGEVFGLGNLLSDFIKTHPEVLTPGNAGRTTGEAIRKALTDNSGGVRGNAPRHWNLPANRGW